MNFTVSIVTAPNDQLVVHKDVELIKLGLLYADQVTVASPNIYYLVAYIKMATLTGKDRLTLVKGLVPSMYSVSKKSLEQFNELVKRYEVAKNKLVKSYEDIQVIIHLDEYLENAYNNFAVLAEKIVIESGIEPLVSLIGDGRIQLTEFGADLTGVPKILLDGALNTLNDDFVYPIFDKGITDLIAAYIKENDTVSKFGNSKEMIVGKDLFLRLPNINQLDVEQVSTLRNEMEVEWYRYKSLINEYADDIEGVPFDPDVNVKLAKKYEREFKPQLLELQQALDKNGFVKHLYNQLLDNIASYSMLCVGAATLTEIKTAMIGASGVAVAQSFKAMNEKRKQTEKVKENKLYFYHHLSMIK